MTEDEKRELVKELYLDDAVSDLSTHGRYWNSSMSRKMTGTLVGLLEEAGLDVFVEEIKPDWEHVFYLPDDEFCLQNLSDIAIKRSAQKEKGIATHLLSK